MSISQYVYETIIGFTNSLINFSLTHTIRFMMLLVLRMLPLTGLKNLSSKLSVSHF